MKREFPGEVYKQVSHETIYRSLYIQARGVLKKELLERFNQATRPDRVKSVYFTEFVVQ